MLWSSISRTPSGGDAGRLFAAIGTALEGARGLAYKRNVAKWEQMKKEIGKHIK